MNVDYGTWYFISFDGELLFHNECRPISVRLKSSKPFTLKKIYKKLEKTDELENDIRKKLKIIKKDKGTLEDGIKFLDSLWQNGEVTSFAILKPGDMGKLIKIIQSSGSDAWDDMDVPV